MPLLHPSWLLALLLLPIALAAQERVPLVGRTLLADGKPWPAATIMLDCAVHPEWPQLGVVDHLEGTSDAQGRFQLAVLPGRTYAVLAREVDAQGRCRFSAMLDAVNEAAPVELRASGGFGAATKVTITGTAPHVTGGPLRLRLASRFVPVELAVAGDGEVTLPPLPHDYTRATVLRADGSLALFTQIVPGVAETIALPPTTPFLVRALDGPQGKPVAGAAVRLRIDEQEWPLGATDANGYAQVDLGCLRHGQQLRDPRMHLLVQKDGLHLGLVHVLDATMRTAEQLAALRQTGDCQALATMSSGRSVTGRVWLDESTPARQLPVLVGCYADVEHHRGAFTGGWQMRLLHTEADGRLAIDPVSMRHDDLQVLAVVDGRVVPIARRMSVEMPLGKAAELGNIRLDGVRRMRLQVALPDGTPALAARVHLGLGSRGRAPVTLCTDRKGTCEVAVAAGVRLDVAIDMPDACWIGRLEGQPAGALMTVPIRMWARRAIACRVSAADGQPATAEIHAEIQQVDLEWSPEASGVVGVARCKGIALQSLLGWLATKVRTGADGTATVQVPPFPGQWLLFANAPPQRDCQPLQLGSEPPAAVEFVLRQ